MDTNHLKRLAGLPVITEKQLSGKAETQKFLESLMKGGK